APPESVVRPIALYHRDIVQRILLFHEQGKVEAGRAATDADDFHVHSREVDMELRCSIWNCDAVIRLVLKHSSEEKRTAQAIRLPSGKRFSASGRALGAARRVAESWQTKGVENPEMLDN